jgi:membrane fusion protein, multidrug efflux system
MNESLTADEKISPNKKEDKSTRQGLSYWLLLPLLLVLALVIYFVNSRHIKHVPVRKAATVVLAVVQKKNVPVIISALGNVTATYTVTVKTQINGLLMSVNFKEGQLVKAGELLAEIDQRLLLAQLTQYEGQLIRDQALLANAQIDLKRYQRLWQQNSVSQQTLATQESLVRQYEGAIKVDQGLIESTKVSLVYTHITSPVDGRIGLRLVDPGNFVQTTDTTGIAIITTLDPITVIFVVPEDDVPKLLPLVFAHKNVSVEAYDRQQNKLLATGTLLTIDNEINTSTGTVRLRAEFANKENKLFANQFVNIKLQVATIANATIVPTAAIMHGSKGEFVYLVKPNFTVTAKPIKSGLTSGDDTVIEKGLRLGEQVVTQGTDKLSEGTKVRIADSTKAARQTTQKPVENS